MPAVIHTLTPICNFVTSFEAEHSEIRMLNRSTRKTMLRPMMAPLCAQIRTIGKEYFTEPLMLSKSLNSPATVLC